MKYCFAIILVMTITGCSAASLETRRYKVGEQFWSSIETTNQPDSEIFAQMANFSRGTDENFRLFLVRAGIPFPDGAYIEMDKAQNIFTARNIPENLDLLEHLMRPLGTYRDFFENRIK
jgi:hypothetical protein